VRTYAKEISVEAVHWCAVRYPFSSFAPYVWAFWAAGIVASSASKHREFVFDPAPNKVAGCKYKFNSFFAGPIQTPIYFSSLDFSPAPQGEGDGYPFDSFK
jgi:hypothetical protein